MDGNGRWAQQRGLPRLAGHRAGTENIRRIVECCVDLGVHYLTLYAFSTENWSRPPDEVAGLMALLVEYVDREVDALHAQGVRLRHLGRLEELAPHLQRTVCRAVELTQHNTRFTLAVALNYGGRAEIVDAVRRLMTDGVAPEDVNEALIGRYLTTGDLPDPDLVIRTAGEMRLSNFLLWQAAYSEYYATPVYWPDFGPKDLEEAVQSFARRQRRFGGLPPA
jgi:undecaprenyl diphosphate synthase